MLLTASVEGYTFDGIWMIDLSLDMHKICSTFSEYLRLAIVHLGLPEWQNLIVSDRQLSPSNIVWIHAHTPLAVCICIHACIFPIVGLVRTVSAQEVGNGSMQWWWFEWPIGHISTQGSCHQVDNSITTNLRKIQTADTIFNPRCYNQFVWEEQ